MTDEYKNFPHIRFLCEYCGVSVTAIGYEVEAVRCPECSAIMEWDKDLHIPGCD